MIEGKTEVRAVTYGVVKRSPQGPWEPAILMLEAPGLSSVITAVLVKDGTVLTAPPYDYRRREMCGSFVVPLDPAE